MTTTTATPATSLACLDAYDGSDCAGDIEYRFPLSASGVAFPRCDRHWDLRLDTQARIDRDYPDSPMAPVWFDPTYAGESWDSDY